MRKVGIMGGTFNPVHFVHLLLAEAAYEQFHLDEIMFLPSKRPAYKPLSELIEEEHRFHMIELAIADNPYFSVSDMEFHRVGNTYTADTLLELSKKYPDTEFYFILGGDSLFELEKWSRPEIVMEKAYIVAAQRDDKDNDLMVQKMTELNEKYKAKIELLQVPMLEVSSRMLRERVKKGQSIRYFLPEAVRSYIIEHGFYL